MDSQNDGPQGIWSDGATMWVADFGDEKAYAYALVGGARQDTNDFDLHTDNDFPDSMTSDGTTVWVSDRTDKKLYAYTLDGGDEAERKRLHHHRSQRRRQWLPRSAVD